MALQKLKAISVVILTVDTGENGTTIGALNDVEKANVVYFSDSPGTRIIQTDIRSIKCYPFPNKSKRKSV